MREYEIKFDKYDYFFNEGHKHDVKYDYFIAKSDKQAKNMCYMKHGDLIDILHCKLI